MNATVNAPGLAKLEGVAAHHFPFKRTVHGWAVAIVLTDLTMLFVLPRYVLPDELEENRKVRPAPPGSSAAPSEDVR